jgi:hypothetical protein
MKPPIPTEHAEAEIFAAYLKITGYLFTHIPNETSIKNWGYLNKMKRAGNNPGYPDYSIVVPTANGKKLAFVELKRIKRSVISPEQQHWIDELNSCGCPSIVAKGADEAIKFIEKLANS